MKKLEMAHDWFMKHATGNPTFIITEVELAWKYADLMQAEEDKREDKGIPDIFKKDKDGNCLHTHTTFGGSECFDCGVNLKVEWQPDWSQAPEWANWWAMDSTGDAYWHSCVDNPYINDGVFEIANPQGHTSDAPLFLYQGSWQDSLRKRPE